MKWYEVEKTASQLTDYLHAKHDDHEPCDVDFRELGQTSIKLVNAVCARILARHARDEARLTDLLERLDAEEERTKKLEERIGQASSSVREAELWLTRVMDAMKANLLASDEPQAATIIAA